MNTLEEFFLVLEQIGRSPDWNPKIEWGCLLLTRPDVGEIFCPMTAAFFECSGVVIHRGSFIFCEISDRYALPWWDILMITVAEINLVWHQQFRPQLRQRMLEALKLQ